MYKKENVYNRNDPKFHYSGEQLGPHASCFTNICSNQAKLNYCIL